MKWAAELAGLALGIKSGCKGDFVWVALDDGLEGGLGLINSRIICLTAVSRALLWLAMTDRLALH